MTDTASLEQMCAAALRRAPDQLAIEFDGRWYDWGDMRRVGEGVAQLLGASGAVPAGPVALMPRTRPSAAAALLGLLTLGRNIRMIYAFQGAEGQLRDVDVRAPTAVVAAADDFTAPLVAGLRARGIAGIALTEMAAAPVPGLERATASGAPDAPPRQVETLTSGTTGPPKRFPLGYDMLAEHIVGRSPMFDDGGIAGAQRTPLLLPAPLGNISGIYGILPTTLRGHPLVLVDRFSVPTWLDYVRRYRPTVANLPASAVQTVLDAEVPREDLASIERITTGAAPLAPSVHRAFEQRYGIPILLGFGATEFAGSVTAMTPELHAAWGEAKFGSVGRVVPGCRIRTIDPATGAVQPPGAEGLLEVVAERMGPDWIRTSDVVMIDADGFVFHRGRADGAIVRGGFKLLPETIETALMRHPAVAAAVAAGIPDRRLGQVPAVALQLRPGAPPPTVAELEAHLRRHVLATHIPTRWRFVAAMPLTPSSKLDRGAVRRLLETETEAEAGTAV